MQTIKKKKVSLSRADFAQKFLYLNGRSLSLKDYPHMVDIYNSKSQEIVMQFSRQTSKSTTIANLAILDSISKQYFKSLYVSPTVDQTKVFSHERVAPVIETSPFIKNNYINSTLVQNVFTKEFLNGSRIFMRYALLNADRLRGLSSDTLYLDECQDLLADVIPVIQETMSRSLSKRTIYTGTPKRTVGTLANIWERSSQKEFMPRCQSCGHWNILDEDNVGLMGVICKKCSKPLDIKNGQWIAVGEKNAEVEGFRVCALHFANAPWVDWQRDILNKRNNTSRAIFYNEVLGLPYDDGVSPVTKAQVVDCCRGGKMDGDVSNCQTRQYPTILGIDYGPVNSEASNTVISIVQKRGKKFHVIYAKKFLGKEADYAFIHDEIPKLMKRWNCKLLASDYGMGEAPNSEFRRRLGYEKVIPFQHMPNQKDHIKWNSKMPAYTLSRNQVMTNFFQRIKSGEYVFPDYSDFETFVSDVINIQQDFNEDTNKMKFINIGPDDFVHATIFASMAVELYGQNDLA
jgi:hypothetical protein